jgi:uncharacterized protein with ParB-like and HNH nuclease domain
VRDLLDSMYRGFPVGYLMLWNAAEVDAKLIGADGKQHTPTEFIVDGQQRLTSLYAVMKGAEITAGYPCRLLDGWRPTLLDPPR